MTPEQGQQLLALLLGPVGALVLAFVIIVVLARVIQSLWRDHMESVRLRLADKDARIIELSDLLDKALGGNESIARAMEERNRLEQQIAARAAGSALSRGLSAAETTIEARKRTR